MTLRGAMAASVKRRRVGAVLSMTPTGSITLPFDFDILAPLHHEPNGGCKRRRNGTAPFEKCSPIIIMRATQKKIMSKPVTNVPVG